MKDISQYTVLCVRLFDKTLYNINYDGIQVARSYSSVSLTDEEFVN